MIETDFVNGHRYGERREQRESAEQEAEVRRDPSRLPVTNLEAYKSWCQRVKDDWDSQDQ